MHPSFKELELAAIQSDRVERFHRLLLEISDIVKVGLDDLKFDDKFKDLCPRSKWSNISVEFDDLQDLAMKETRGLGTPDDISTVGKLLSWMLKAPNIK